MVQEFGQYNICLFTRCTFFALLCVTNLSADKNDQKKFFFQRRMLNQSHSEFPFMNILLMLQFTNLCL